MICKHGFVGTCTKCHAEQEAEERRMVKAGEAVFAVLPWRGDRNYKIADALKTFRVRSAAERWAMKRDPSRLVVRCVLDDRANY